MSDYRYQLVAGHPALDFLNTIDDWTAAEREDRLAEFPDAVRFGVAAGVLTHAEARALGSRRAGEEIGRLRELRGRLERILGALLARDAPRQADLDRLAKDAAGAAEAVRLRSVGGHLVQRIVAADAGAATLRYRLVEAAITLLRSPRWERVNRCPRCGWFFLDTSKNGSRRWCSMALCGSATKSRNYYRRNRGRGLTRT
jgi:predicted RNA-binding Zn ribbon-like protein